MRYDINDLCNLTHYCSEMECIIVTPIRWVRYNSRGIIWSSAKRVQARDIKIGFSPERKEYIQTKFAAWRKEKCI